MTPISFYTDQHGFPAYSTTDERYVALGVWFKMELRDSPYQCLDLLAVINDVASGRTTAGRWEGEAFDVPITAAGVSTHNMITDGNRATYTLQELREAAEDYWRYLAGGPRAQADVEDWERTWGRPHPYRGRLF